MCLCVRAVPSPGKSACALFSAEVNNEIPLQEEQAEESQGRAEPSIGSKRPREEERERDRDRDRDRERDRGSRRHPDPTNAPDPDEPDEFDENVMRGLVDDQFQQPEDDSVVTLDRCEYVCVCTCVCICGWVGGCGRIVYR